jgi:hypothetical protein
MRLFFAIWSDITPCCRVLNEKLIFTHFDKKKSIQFSEKLAIGPSLQIVKSN